MSRPYKECILFDTVYADGSGLPTSNSSNLVVRHDYKINLKDSRVNILWRGSIDKFKKDFEIPEDAPLSTKDTNLPNGGNAKFVYNWDWTTMNFKFNYHIWYRNAGSSNFNYVLGSNNTIDLTIPNVLVFNGSKNYDTGITATGNVYYNPNLFPLHISINSFPTSNKISDWQAVTGQGTDSLAYLVFRYGVDGDDIQICLLTKNNNSFQVNSQPLIMTYASLTFTGFNKIKRLSRDLP